MDTPTAPNDWRTVLKDERRTLRWLAEQTGRPVRTVYAYHQGRLPPTREWLTRVSAVLGREVTA